MHGKHIGRSSLSQNGLVRYLDVSSQFAIRPHRSPKRRGRLPGPRHPIYCDRGTCGPEGAAGGCSCWRSVSSTPPPPCPSGAPGVCCAGVPVFWMIDRGLRSRPARIESTKLVAKNVAARMAVVRVSTFDVPRLDKNPPVEPIPSPPPSDFCNRTTPIMAVTTMR